MHRDDKRKTRDEIIRRRQTRALKRGEHFTRSGRVRQAVA